MSSTDRDGRKKYYAHRTESDNQEEWQTLRAHLEGVARLAKEFAAQFGAGEWGRLLGLLHDAGKYSEAFQRRLEGHPQSVDHSTAGAQYISELWKRGDKRSPISNLLAYAVAGHHAGLSDFGSLASDGRALAQRLQKKVEPYQHTFEQELALRIHAPPTIPLQSSYHQGVQFSLFIRMLFSCLVDADSLDTEKYANAKQYAGRTAHTPLQELIHTYRNYMKITFPASSNRIKKLRAELLEEILKQANRAPGLYSLTLPTGSGKTLISLGFALEHAISYPQMRRIVFVIPYTAIAEQNADVFRAALGKEAVLEHHSNVQHNSDLDIEKFEELGKLERKLELAAENWDYPIIVTTNVQFFESLFSNKRSRCRKLHNLANSIIVIDEAQMMNGEFFKPCLYALAELSQNYGATVVFSTATQPPIKQLFDKSVQIHEIVKDVPLRFDQFCRVRPKHLHLLEEEELCQQVAKQRQVLCVVNTRRAARDIYNRVRELVTEVSSVFHLSARMCPMHRKAKLEEIRHRLDHKQPCVLISTQLIECGVDVDFPIVYREMAGLDSIAQAAGRCNRNGGPELGTVFIFETANTPRKGWFGLTSDIAGKILARFPDEPLSLAAMEAYFQELFFYQSAISSGQDEKSDLMDKYGILPLLQEKSKLLEFPFETVAHKFQLIQSEALPVIVHYSDQVTALIDELRYAKGITGVLRKLQPYIVQLYPPEFQAFLYAGELKEIREKIFYLDNPRWYKDDIGVQPFSEDFHASEVYVY